MVEFICRACFKRKDIENQSLTHRKTCNACDERIGRISQARYKPTAKQVYMEDKIRFIAK